MDYRIEIKKYLLDAGSKGPLKKVLEEKIVMTMVKNNYLEFKKQNPWMFHSQNPRDLFQIKVTKLKKR